MVPALSLLPQLFLFGFAHLHVLFDKRWRLALLFQLLNAKERQA
jgi:hypothetical protein